MTGAQNLADGWSSGLRSRLDLVEVRLDPLEVDGAPAGRVAVLESGSVGVRVVDVRLVVPDRGIDAVMVHAFAPADRPIPHLLSDLAVMTGAGGGPRWHVHVDLAPRLDPVLHPTALPAQLEPITPASVALASIPGAVPIDVPRRLRSLASPWLVGVIVGPDDHVAVDDGVRAYLDRFISLVQADAPRDEALIERDEAHRRALFDPGTDEVWDVLARLVGAAPVERLLDDLRTPGVRAAGS